MLKKVFCIFISIIFVCNLTFFAIAEEENVTLLHDCNTAFGLFKVDRDPDVGNCLTYRFDGSAVDFASAVQFPPKDASDADTLAIDIYFSDLDMIAYIDQLYLEITSSGTCDHQENAWPIQSLLKPDKMQPGWNTIYLYLTDSYVTDGSCDLSAINYIRIFSFFNAKKLVGETIKFDNIRMIYTGGYDYSDISLDFYRGDNLDTDIRIEGQQAPDLANRHANITTAVGRKAD
jgi:hypothetical protein